MRQSQTWEVQSQGTWTAEVGSLKLVVLQCEKWARFLISRPKSGNDTMPDALLRSGARDDVGTAMAAAETEARRLEAVFMTMDRAA